MRIRTFQRLGWLEWAALLLMALLVARYIWAAEVIAFEDSFFAALGLRSEAKYVVLIPLAALLFYRIYAREHIKVAERGSPVVRPLVLGVAGALLVGVIVAAYLVASP